MIAESVRDGIVQPGERSGVEEGLIGFIAL